MKLAVEDETSIKLTQLQHKLFEQNLGTLIMFEGPGGPVMSHIINEIISVFEPRNLDYHHVDPTDPTWISTAVNSVPGCGRIAIFDRAWYSGTLMGPDKMVDIYTHSIMALERFLVNNKVNIIKIFLDMEEGVIKENRDSYMLDLDADCGFLDDGEAKYSDFSITKKRVARIIEVTNTSYAPWDVIRVTSFKKTVRAISEALVSRLEHRIEHPVVPEFYQVLEMYRNPREDVKFDGKISSKDYTEKLDKLQRKLADQQAKLAGSNKALILMFEGWDAAGKGGIIKRITRCLNPRGYKTVPIPAPTREEKAHTHLWRFSTRLPAPGHIVIFDRSWYGRMMVEPIEGFCSDDEYSRAGDEINMFEALLYYQDIILIKFWVDITKDEQLVRFKDRQENPLKQWKITEEDWRNREKWDVYEKYVNSMMKQTNTPIAPWHVIENNDKKYGRIQALEIITDILDKELD